MKKELRSCRRVPTANLKIFLLSGGGLFGNKKEELKSSNYSLSGMHIETKREYKICDKINVSLYLEIDMGVIEVKKISATIVRVNEENGFFQYGVRFEKKAIKNTESYTYKNLLRIKKFLAKKEEFEKRFSQVSMEV